MRTLVHTVKFLVSTKKVNKGVGGGGNIFYFCLIDRKHSLKLIYYLIIIEVLLGKSKYK